MSEGLRCLFSLTLSGGALTLVVAGVNRLLRRRVPAAFCYYLWLVVLARFLLPWGPEASLSHRAVEQTAQLWVVLEQGEATWRGEIAPPQGDLADKTADPVLSLSEALTAVWAGGVVVAGGRCLWSYRRLCRALRGSATPATGRDREIYRNLVGRDGSAPELLRAEGVDGPMLVGLIRPRIYLPAGEMPEPYLRHALAHELVHWRRHDLLFRCGAVAVATFHWFNPLAHWLVREIARDGELSCDQAVTARLSRGERAEYGETLLWAAQRQKRRDLPLAVPLWSQKQCLKERLQTVMQEKKMSRWSKFWMSGAVLAAVAAFLVVGAYAGNVPEEPEAGSGPESEVTSVLPSTGPLAWPFPDRGEVALTNLFGERVHPITGQVSVHSGVDIKLEQDTPVLAAAAGTVAEAGFDPALGNYLVLDHGGGLTTTYGQLARNDFVAVDGQVEAGEQIGTVGKTGQATGYHLHFEVAENGTQVDPLDHLMPGRLADRT